MINIQTIPDISIYTYGSWTSQTLTNSKSSFPTGTTSEWGSLLWDEENVGTGYTGLIRIDILNAADNSVLVADIVKNADSIPTDISAYALTYDIKIKVKLYGADWPTPAVKNIRLKYKNWDHEQVITNNGKNLLMNRALLTPTANAIYDVRLGNGQTTQITESSTGLTNEISSAYPISGAYSSVTFNETEGIVEVTFLVDNSGTIVANGTVMNAIGFKNNDASPLFVSGARYADITKNANINYTFKAAFKLYSKPSTSYVFDRMGRNLFLNRLFSSAPTYTGLKYGTVGFQTNELTDEITALDSTLFGPSVFNYTIIDTTKYRLSTSVYQATTDGNGNTYNSIGQTNNDGSPLFIFAALTDENVVKTSTYIYQYIVNYNSLTPIDTLL